MPQFRKKPVLVDAFKWTGGPDQTEDPLWIIEALRKPWYEENAVRIVSPKAGGALLIAKLAGIQTAAPGDWIIRERDGTLSVMTEAEFREAYEAV